MKVKKLTLKRWCNALRSGKFKQTTEGLYSSETNGFCCLGVAGFLQGVPKESLIGNAYLGSLKIKGVKCPATEFSEEEIADINDGVGDYKRHTFKQIAKILQGKMKPKLKSL